MSKNLPRNFIIREALEAHHVRYWQLADALGMTDSTLSRKLRKELPKDVRDEWLAVIYQLAEDKKEELENEER